MPEITQEQLDAFTKLDADLKAEKEKSDKLAAEAESIRTQVLTPEYTAFLDSLSAGDKDKDKGKSKNDNQDKDDEEFKKLTPRQLYEKAKNDAIAELKGLSQREKEDAAKEKDLKLKRELLEFAKTHDDFEQFRPIMYGLSLDPKHAEKTLPQLYDEAKEHIRKVAGKPTKEEEERKKRMGNFKPGGNSDSYDKNKKLSQSELGKEALKEVQEQLGPIPEA